MPFFSLLYLFLYFIVCGVLFFISNGIFPLMYDSSQRKALVPWLLKSVALFIFFLLMTYLFQVILLNRPFAIFIAYGHTFLKLTLALTVIDYFLRRCNNELPLNATTKLLLTVVFCILSVLIIYFSILTLIIGLLVIGFDVFLWIKQKSK